MTTETDTTVDIEGTVGLDDFEKLLHGKETPAEEEVKKEVKEDSSDEIEDDALANDESDDEDDGDGNDESEGETDEEGDADDDEEKKPEPKPKRNKTQERIEKLVAEARIAERERDAAIQELERVRALKEKTQIEEAPALKEVLPPEAPKADAVDKDGKPVYELGEFDPQFIRDLTKFTINEENQKAKAEAALKTQEEAIAAQRKEIQSKWQDNLVKAEAEIPEIRENIKDLTDTFASIDQNYGEYLATSIMSLESGPQIMNYLSQNIGEAQKIVASGPFAATIALGRLEALLSKGSQAKSNSQKKLSNASEPPPKKNRGSGAAKTIRADTTNLDDFEKIFYTK